MNHKHFLFVLGVLITPRLSAEKAACSPSVSHIAITSGSFSSRPGVIFQLRNFNATLVPIGRTAPACYEKMTVVSRAEIFVSNESLTNVFSDKLQASESKITDFKVTNGLSSATLSGKIKHLIPINFSIEGPVSTDGSSIRLDATRIKADGIPVKELLHLVGAELNSVLQLKGVSGVQIEQNALSFSPEQVAHLRGHIASVSTSSEGLTLRYTSVHRTGVGIRDSGEKLIPIHAPSR